MQNPFVTIDSSSTRDIDDAMSVEVIAGGGYKVSVAIANPTRLVKIGSTEDDRARRLGATAYIRDQAVRKMLPSRISEDEGSLVEGASRKAMIFEVVLSANLEVQSFAPSSGEIVVGHRLSYEQIPQILAAPEHQLHTMLTSAAHLARLLLQARRTRGALALYDLSRFLLTDEEGSVRQYRSVDEVIGNILVQEMMILTNSLVGQFMYEHNLPAVYRNHQPKAAAPQSDELAKTIEAWVSSGSADTESVQAQFNAIAGKARYGAVVIGHYGLNLPLYLHATSPLRRYANLVNMRQLAAHLSGKALPYQVTDLEVIANDLNEAMDRRQEERSNGFKSVVARTACRAVNLGDLTKLADHELSAAVKIAPEAGYLPQALIEELIRRMEKATFADTVADRLVFELPRELITGPLAEAAGRWIQMNPPRAMHLLMHGCQIGYFADIATSYDQSDGLFSATTSVTVVSTGQVITKTGTGGRKREAEQAAAVKLVAEVFGFPLNGAQDDVVTAAVGQIDMSGNPKGKLLELCQKQRWASPTFKTEGFGPSHQMVFRSVVSVDVAGVSYQGEAKQEATKKEAEAVACARLLERLEPVVRNFANAKPSGGAISNAVGALQELAQKQKCVFPEYQFESNAGSSPSFRCTVTIFFNGKKNSFSSTASNKQEAKRSAAEMAFASL